ncbi:MAG TPA: hypothetical protein VF409_11670, partial [Sphingomonas sp.]
TDVPNTSRLMVLLQLPVTYVVVLLGFLAKDLIVDHAAVLQVVSVFGASFFLAVMLIAQQVQLWGVRRLMRKCS